MTDRPRLGRGRASALAVWALGFGALAFVWFEAGVEVRVLCGNLASGVDEGSARAMFATGTFLEVADVSGGLEVSTPWDLRTSRCRVDLAGGEVVVATVERRLDLARAAAGVGGVLLAGLTVFQLALAAGAPLGAAAWGGEHPGRLPARLRGASLVSAIVLVFGGWALVSRAGVPGGDPPGWTGVVVGVFAVLFALSTVGNLLSTSRVERRYMMPVAMLLWATFVVVALSK